MAERLPLFLLDTVLLPQTQLPLHVFEPRYLEMVRQCLERDSLFGVNLIAEGSEVGGVASPALVGTTARILSLRHQPDGRILLIAGGERRYRIIELDHSRPFLQARVEYLDDGADDADAELGRRVLDRFSRLLEEMGQRVEFDDALLKNPERISFAVAAHLARSNEEKQTLLETDGACERLELVEGWLEEHLETLIERREIEDQVRRNGRLRPLE